LGRASNFDDYHMMSRPTEDVDEAAIERTRDNDRIAFGLNFDATENSAAPPSVKKSTAAPAVKTAAKSAAKVDVHTLDDDEDDSDSSSDDSSTKMADAIREDDLAREKRERAAFIGRNDEDEGDEDGDIFKLDAGVGRKRKQKPITSDEEEEGPPKMLSNLQFLKQQGLLKSNTIPRKESSLKGIPEQDLNNEEEDEEEEEMNDGDEDAAKIDEAKQQFDDAVAAAAKKKENADKVKTRGKGRKK
jgi:hypothetical protein